MAGDEFGITTGTSVASTGYLKQIGKVKKLTPEEKATFIEELKKIRLENPSGFQPITDKNGKIRMGRIVKYQKPSLKDILNGDIKKTLAKVKKAQVKKFLEKIRALGLDISEDDIITKNGTLNPNFKVDNKGNISFRDFKAYINGKAPKYFETEKGEWAVERPDIFSAMTTPKTVDGGKKRFLPYYPTDNIKPIIDIYYPGRDNAKVEKLPYYPFRDNTKIELQNDKIDYTKYIA